MTSSPHVFARVATLAAVLILSVSLPRPASASLVVLRGFPTLKQQHSLTCEASAASMGTRASLSESQIMAVIPRNPNPNLGFRGNPRGEQGATLVDYGVYASPVQKALLHYDYRSKLFLPGNDSAIKTQINRGWPVVAWVTYQLKVAVPRLASANGVQFVLVPHEHAVLIVGYDNRTVLANDPWTKSQVRYLWRDFNRAWGYFGNMALAVEPCELPQRIPSGSLQVTRLKAKKLILGWAPATRASSYAVSLYRVDSGSVLVSSSTQTTLTFTLKSPVPGARYEIAVKPLSSCGGSASTTRLVVQIPISFATPTPSPTEVLVSPTPTATITTTVTPSP